MLDLTPWTETPWLAEPNRLRQLAAKVLAVRPCPTAKEVAQCRRERLELARELPRHALASTGIDLPEEMAAAPTGKAIRAVKGKVGVIQVFGPVAQRMSGELMKADGTSLEEVGAAFDAMMGNASVGGIVLQIDSPGGSSYGVEELAGRIFDARGKKPVYAIADSMAASAALWLASAADMVIATPGGDVGSVGVYVMHLDQSAATEAEGVKVSFVSAGKYKTEGNPFEPLSDEARANLQDMVNYTYSRFIDALKRNRNTTAEDVRKNYGQGRLMNPEQAREAGMIDRVMSFPDLMARLTGGTAEGSNGGPRGASMEVLRARHQHEKMKTVGA